jgi:hypothetical protein
MRVVTSHRQGKIRNFRARNLKRIKMNGEMKKDRKSIE